MRNSGGFQNENLARKKITIIKHIFSFNYTFLEVTALNVPENVIFLESNSQVPPSYKAHVCVISLHDHISLRVGDEFVGVLAVYQTK